MSDTPAHDPCADFLDNSPKAPADAAFQQRLLEQTRRLLRRHWWQRRAGFTAALAACYLAGVVTMGLLRPAASAPPEMVKADGSQQPASPSEEAVSRLTALALENRAFDSEEPRPELYRLAGDRYLAESGNLQAALRCYRQALDESPEQDLQVKPEDNWLLIALKESRQKEKENAKPND
jgi:tetratricopeptide (TPR) repeat protein